jgi:hypothetical protein
MTGIAPLLRELRHQGVLIVIEGASLFVRGPDTVLTPRVVAALRARKPEIIACLQAERRPEGVHLVRHTHRCPCGREFRCTAPSCAGKDVPCVCCRLDEIEQRGPAARTAVRSTRTR